MTEWQMYWLLRLDGIKDMFEVITVLLTIAVVLLGIGFLVCFFISKADEHEDATRVAKSLKHGFLITVLLCLFFTFVWILLPTTKQMAAILVVPKIINNEQVQELPEKIVELGNEWMDDKIKELKGAEQ